MPDPSRNIMDLCRMRQWIMTWNHRQDNSMIPIIHYEEYIIKIPISITCTGFG